MQRIYIRAILTALACAVLINSYLAFKAAVVNARTTSQSSSGAIADGDTPVATKHIALRRVNLQDMSAQWLGRIKTAREVRDMNELAKIGDEIEATWSNLDASQYASLMFEVCNAFSSTILNDDHQYVLEQRYASLVLNKRLILPAKIEAELMLHLQEDIEYVKGQLSEKEWVARRRDKSELWFRIGQHLNAAIDPNFDFKDLPFENVPLPKGVSGVAGMSPDGIKDPMLRAQYQSAIDANSKKAEAFRTQQALCTAREIYLKRMEAYLIRSFSQPPERIEELEELLKTQLLNEHTRAIILNTVKSEWPAPHSE